MPRVIFLTASTLNGYLADNNNSLDWLFAVPDDGQAVEANKQFMESVGALVEGSTTYQWVLDNEDIVAHPERWQNFHGDRPTFVFTRRQLPVVAGADVTFVQGSVADAYPRIVEVAGDKDIWVLGGGDLVGQFLDAGLLDEIVVQFAPATVATGAPLLPRTLGADRLRLMSVTQRGQFAELRYTVSS